MLKQIVVSIDQLTREWCDLARQIQNGEIIAIISHDDQSLELVAFVPGLSGELIDSSKTAIMEKPA